MLDKASQGLGMEDIVQYSEDAMQAVDEADGVDLRQAFVLIGYPTSS